ncbi:hypothetical protein BU15DRAFT_80249 [Melanogaster broomeanus]|nr:hypothetical protein BU15DRAFT_80249 [Melanogaster broomeanus]
MSSSSTTTSPSSAELGNLGVLFVGFVAATILYGLTFFQSYIYYSQFPRDHKWIKCFVSTLCVLDTAASAIVSQVLYYYLIVLYNVSMDTLYATTTFCLIGLKVSIFAVGAHGSLSDEWYWTTPFMYIEPVGISFFAHRVFQVTGGSRPVTLAVVFFSFISFGKLSSANGHVGPRLMRENIGSLWIDIFGANVCRRILRLVWLAHRRLSDVGLASVEVRDFVSHTTPSAGTTPMTKLVGQQIIAALSQGSAAIADVVIFVTMCYSLRRARYPGIVVPENIVDQITRLFVGRGLEFTIIQIAYLCVLLAFPTKPYWIAFQMVGVKFYVNAVLGLLNARQIRHGKGLYEEESSIERKPTPGAGLPSGLLFNAVDTRVTQQNVTFLSRHPDVESSGSEMESRKTYQDESGVSASAGVCFFLLFVSLGFHAG